MRPVVSVSPDAFPWSRSIVTDRAAEVPRTWPLVKEFAEVSAALDAALVSSDAVPACSDAVPVGADAMPISSDAAPASPRDSPEDPDAHPLDSPNALGHEQWNRFGISLCLRAATWDDRQHCYELRSATPERFGFPDRSTPS